MTISQPQPFTVDIVDPRIVPGQQQALQRFYASGIAEPGLYVCGPETTYADIDWHFAYNFQSMEAPHPQQPLRPGPGGPTVWPGVKVYDIVDFTREVEWRRQFRILLRVRLVDGRQVTARPEGAQT